MDRRSFLASLAALFTRAPEKCVSVESVVNREVMKWYDQVASVTWTIQCSDGTVIKRAV